VPTPSTTSLADLLIPDSEDDILELLLTELSAESFPVTAWDNLGVAVDIIRAEATALTKLSALVREVAAGGALSEATAGWLEILAEWFGLTKVLASAAVVFVEASNSTGSPITITPGQLWARNPLTNLLYNSANSANVVVPAGGFATLNFRAEKTGAVYNLTLADSLTLVTSVPGLTLAPEDTGTGTGTPMVTQGQDDEADATLVERCRTQWSTIGIQKTQDSYAALVRKTPAITTLPTKVFVDTTNPRGPGTIDVWLAGPTGPLGGGDLALIQAYVLARETPCADTDVANAATLTINFVGDVYVSSSFVSTAPSEIVIDLTEAVDAVNIGGMLSYAELIGVVVTTPGVVDLLNFTVNAGVVNLQLLANQVAVTGTFTFNYFTVA